MLNCFCAVPYWTCSTCRRPCCEFIIQHSQCESNDGCRRTIIIEAQLHPSRSGGTTAVIPGSPTRTVTRSPATNRDAWSSSLLAFVMRFAVVESIAFSETFEPTRSGTVPALSKYVEGLMTKPTLCLGEMRLRAFTSQSSGVTPTSVCL